MLPTVHGRAGLRGRRPEQLPAMARRHTLADAPRGTLQGKNEDPGTIWLLSTALIGNIKSLMVNLPEQALANRTLIVKGAIPGIA